MPIQINCHDVTQAYLDHLSKEFDFLDYEDNVCRIITPYWRDDGDHIEVFARLRPDGSLLLTDEGYSVEWLYSMGIDASANEIQENLIENLVVRYGLSFERGIVELQSSPTEIGENFHRFLTALRAIGQVPMFRQQRGKPTFREEVEQFLIVAQQDYTAGYKIKGKTIEHNVDFYLNSGRNILVETITATAPTNAGNAVKLVAFQWLDIREAGWTHQKITVIDDSGDKMDRIWRREKVRGPLYEYSDRVIQWSQRDTLLTLQGSGSEDK